MLAEDHDPFKVLAEVSLDVDLRGLHPLKLDRWHRTLLGIPEPIYLQYGCSALLEHVLRSAAALRAMVDLLGIEGLPVRPQELTQRAIQTFRWYVPSGQDPVEFVATWEKTSSSWRLVGPGITSFAPNLEAAFAASIQQIKG